MRRPAHAMMIIVVAAPVLLTTVVPASAVPSPGPEGAAAAAPQYEVAAVISDGHRSPIGRGMNGDVIIADTKDRTDRDGRARLSYEFGAVFSGEIFEFCVTKITHAEYDYDVPPEPSCASVTVPG